MVLNKNIDEENKETHDDSSSKEDEASTLDPIDIEDLEHPLQDEPDLNLGVGAALELFKKRGSLLI
ncbi:hypothetical protein HMI56_003877 [Coelomomyces lativittatus]|nr:hypothetical protein HMI56_003877 [Coelomomyces lativittatus]